MMADGNNIELMLKHLIDSFDKSYSAINVRLDQSHADLNSRLDQINKSVNQIPGHKIIIENIDKRTTHIEESNKERDKTIRSLRDSVIRLEHDAKRREELSKSITNPLIQKAIWAAAFCIITVIVGYGIDHVENISKVQRANLMSH